MMLGRYRKRGITMREYQEIDFYSLNEHIVLPKDCSCTLSVICCDRGLRIGIYAAKSE